MKSKILRTKMVLYLVLVVLTVIFARLSFALYANDFDGRLRPQIVRAMIQVSKILPELEENEQAIRDINDNLEKRRQSIYDVHEEDLDELEDSEIGTEENVETVVDHTLSWMNRVTKLRVGREGRVIVVSQEDYTILACPEEEYVGQKLYLIGGEKFDIEAVPDLEELGGSLSKKDIPQGLNIFAPASIARMLMKQQLGALASGIIGSVFAYKDTYILCGVTLGEGITYVVVRCLVSTLIFFVIAWVLARYIGFALSWRRDGVKAFRRKMVSYCALGTVLLLVAAWYYQTIMDVTGDLATMNEHAKAAVETLDTYRQYRKELSEWLDQQYLEQCRLAAELVKTQGKENITRQELDAYAKELKVEYIYVFDKKGKVVVTNSPYDHFRLSENKEDQSYAFRPLLDGREYVIQGVQKDEASGEKMQYIGVSLRNEDDLADGFVQIAVKPALRERLLGPIDVQAVLDNLVIGLPDYALAIDKDSLEIVATTGLGYENTNIEELGINADNIQNGFNGYYIIGGVPYYSGISESEDLYLMPVVRSTENTNTFIIALKMALLGAVAYLVILAIAVLNYAKVLVAAEQEVSEADDAASAEDAAGESGEAGAGNSMGLLKKILKVEEKSDYEKRDFEKRWRKQSTIPVEEQTPEMRTSRIIYRLLLVFSLALILYETALISLGITTECLNGFSYVLLGNWERGVNLFSFSFCLFLLCVLYVFRVLINQVLYHIAQISDLRHETILLMLRNALRYACAIIFLYVGLAQFGIDTKALWASAGVLSLMIGFGAKDLISDIIAGIFIIFEDTIRIGDFVTIGDWYGTVEKIGIRSTRIGYYSDTKIFNNSSLRDIINADGDEAREILRVPVPYETDLLEVEKLLKKELPLMTERVSDLTKPPKYQGVNSLEDSCVMLRIAIFTPSYARRRALRDVRREVKLLFDREHISIPFNHVVVKEYDPEEGTYVYMPEHDTVDDVAKEKVKWDKKKADYKS